jgi:hypothetical protein
MLVKAIAHPFQSKYVESFLPDLAVRVDSEQAVYFQAVLKVFKFKTTWRDNYGRGWNNRSGKKRLNSIKMPAVINIQKVASTGAVERYFRK